MSLFDCHLCCTNREFNTFAKFFRHITLYHQNDHGFQITCNLKSKCGVSYRTYSAYKAHIYRHHYSELHSSETNNYNTDLISVDDHQEDIDLNPDLDSNMINGDDNDEDTSYYVDNNFLLDFSELENQIYSDEASTSSFPNIDRNNKPMTILDLKRSYTSFILKLREEFYLPKTTIDSISCYLITLLSHLVFLFEEKALISNCDNTLETSKKIPTIKSIEIKTLKDIVNHLCKEITNITKNEYQFIKYCKEFYNYTQPEEIILSEKDEKMERAYYIPIDRTLSLMLRCQPILTEILQHAQKQRLQTRIDDDLLISYRDGVYGSRVDDDSLLIQLYTDDIGVTNPIGPKKDKHKLSMVYFSIEDIPDQYRARLDFINLVGICHSKVLKVKCLH